MKRFLILPLFIFMAMPVLVRTVLAETGQGKFTFKYVNQRLDPGSYTLTIGEGGDGHFHSEPGTDVQSREPLLPPEDRDIHLSPALTTQIFSTARQVHFFSVTCEDGKGKIAFQGTKTLIYEGPDGHGSCEFNWSKDVRIQKLADQMISVATTLNVGRRLESEHVHDRLGLDEELDNLTHLVANGQATEISNIADTLKSIAEDEAVVGRARRRARALLEGEKTSSK